MTEQKAREAARLISILDIARDSKAVFMARKNRDLNIVFTDKGGFSGDWVFPNEFGPTLTNRIKVEIERLYIDWIERTEKQIKEL